MIKDLIKKILLEYHDDYFSISYYDEVGDDYLTEAIYPSRKEIEELGYTPEPISDEEESYINAYLDVINKGDSDIAVNKNKNRDGILGIFTSRSGKTSKIKFEIELTRHWFFRLHRTADPKSKQYPRIIDPKPLECLELINKNANELAKFVILKKPNYKVRWRVNGPNSLNFIVIFINQDLEATKYKILLVNQIKGEDFFDEKSQNRISLR